MKLLIVLAALLAVACAAPEPTPGPLAQSVGINAEGGTLPEIETPTPAAVVSDGLVIPENADYAARFFPTTETQLGIERIEVPADVWPRPAWCPTWATWKLHTVPRYQYETPTCMTPEWFAFVGNWTLPECRSTAKAGTKEGLALDGIVPGTARAYRLDLAIYTTCPNEALVKLY